MPFRRRLGLALLALLPFLNGLPYDFTYDDKLIIRDNDRLESPAKVGEIFTTQYFGGALTSAQNYRPILLLTYAVQRWIHGNRAWLFRAVNLALHAAVTVSFAAWLFALGFAAGPASAAAALFAVATIHVEAVTSLVGRAELLAALLVFAVALLWLRATRGGRLAKGPYSAALAVFLLAVFVKENAVVAPGVLLLGELFRGGRGRSPREAWAGLAARARWGLAGFALPLAVLFAVRFVVIKGFLISKEAGIFELENPLVGMPFPVRAANALNLALRYLGKTLLPIRLSADHSAYALPLVRSLREPAAWVGPAGALLAAVVALALWKRRPLAAFGLCFFAGTLFPASNVPFVVGTIFAERLAYLPSAGLFCLAVGLLAAPVREVPRPARPWREFLLLAVVVAYAGATAFRNRAWKDDATLYADMVAKVPRSAKAHYNVAWDAQREGGRAEAMAQLREAVAIFPGYYDAWALLGKQLWDEKKWDEAVACYRKSVEIFPTYENGNWGLAKTLEESGRTEEARKAFEAAHDRLPDSYPVAYHRAAFLEEHGSLEDAEDAWDDAVENGDGTVSARLAHARVLRKLGREEEAWDEARFALVRDSASGEARRFLAEGYERNGRTLAAGAEWTRAVRANPADQILASELLEYAVRHPESRFRAGMQVTDIRRSIPKPDERLAKALAAFGA
ncbi:MAG TPA: tetratricopeptide repeat protein [Thermoanaerobaculia bacterium]|nr:tetratricopeptide repeat protein [Thermoanaerobaculia bacterium]